MSIVIVWNYPPEGERSIRFIRGPFADDITAWAWAEENVDRRMVWSVEDVEEVEAA